MNIYEKKLKEVYHYPKHAEGEVGIEIEAEGHNLVKEIPNHWKVHEDGSLRGRDNAEYVLRKPVDRDKVRHVLEYLTKKLEQHDSVCDYSWRTSVHIHVNVLEEKLKDIYNYICLYTLFEDILSEFCGPNRVGNLFCLRMKDAEYLLDYIKNSISKRHNPIDYYNNDDIRYAAINLCALCKYGSLEFRAYHGTHDVEEISNWVHILLNLKDSSKNFKNPQEIVEKLSLLGPKAFVEKVLDEESFRILGHYLDFNSVYRNVRFIQDIAYAVDWKEPQVNKPVGEDAFMAFVGGHAGRENRVGGADLDNQAIRDALDRIRRDFGPRPAGRAGGVMVVDEIREDEGDDDEWIPEDHPNDNF